MIGMRALSSVALRSGLRTMNAPKQVVYSGAGIAVPQLFISSTHMSPWENNGGNNIGFSATANTSTDRLTIPGNNGRLGRAQWCVIVSGTPPAPLSLNTDYVILNKLPDAVGDGSDNTNFQLATLADPTTPIDLTTAGSGITIQLKNDDLGMPPGLCRVMDSAFPTYASIAAGGDGVYDWSTFDIYMDYHCKQRGRQILFTFQDTPVWNRGGGDSQVKPADLTKPGVFAAALLNRYNKVSAFNPAGIKMVWGFEAWNEPAFSASAGTRFNNGTLADLAQLTRHLRTAVKAVDATVNIVGPGFTVGLASTPPNLAGNSMYRWLIASDGAAGQGKDHIDLLAWHSYSPQSNDGALVQTAATIAMYRSFAEAAGLAPNFPAIMTERGVELGNHPLTHARLQAVEMACGMSAAVIFQNSSYGLNPKNAPGLVAALNLLYTTVCGKTLTYCAVEQDNSVTVTANGVTINI